MINETRKSYTIGKIKFSIGSENLRLSAKIGSNLTFKGGSGDKGYFKSIADAEQYLEDKREAFENCKTMNKLIFI